jgi:hypothetical protein
MFDRLKGRTSGKPFVAVSLAENFGQGDDRETTYYKGVVFKDEYMAALKKGQFVEFKGVLTSKGFNKQDGTIGTENNVRIFALTVLSEPKEQPTNAAQPAAAAAQPGTPASAQSEEEATHQSRWADEMAAADDIPF